MDLLEVPEHVHPLKLIDLQLEYPLYYEDEEEEDDDDDEGGDLIIKKHFHGVPCDRCGQDIHVYHKHYYMCMEDSSCHFSLHKFCAELPSMLEYPLHPHPLILDENQTYSSCNVCKKTHNGMWYICSKCYFTIHVICALEVGKIVIHHPCHPHLLMCSIPNKPILCECSACGKRHEGIFYQCTICHGFTIHTECAFLPKSLLIQHTTYDAFYHTHPLTISYSFPRKDQNAKHNPKCRVCGKRFYNTEELWIYKCDKCLYYAHVDCATPTKDPFMSIFLPPGLGKTVKNYKDVDHPHLLHLPFPDETYSLPKHLFFLESGTSNYEANLKDVLHQHPLILVNPTQIDINCQTSSLLLKCHNPMKKTQLLCNGCIRPIMSSMLFYKCAEVICNFALHEWCARLPPKIDKHRGHPQHPLNLMHSNIPHSFFDVFSCAMCQQPCNGFAYCCVECGFYIDVGCGFIPEEITHKAHPNHLLSLVRSPYSYYKFCRICLTSLRRYDSLKSHLSYKCNVCNIYMHPQCTLLLPETIRRKHDKHPLHLSYLPIENHKGEYFCEVCEEDLNPHRSFYHCQDCVQSIHTVCAKLILQSDTYNHSYYLKGLHDFVNIKFGDILKSDGHQHPLSFAQGIVSDGRCNICYKNFNCDMIFKCLECKFAIHYKCCERLKNL
ncbi:hypothetical protein Lser_V15G40208 [Lactuca serriola]